MGNELFQSFPNYHGERRAALAVAHWLIAPAGRKDHGTQTVSTVLQLSRQAQGRPCWHKLARRD